MSSTLDKFINLWSCLQFSHIPLINKFLFISYNFCKTIEEFTWFPKNIGSKIDKSSSIITFPDKVFETLNESKRYSGNYFSGWSKTFLTLTKRPYFSERIISLSIRSIDYQTSITSLDSPLSFISCSSDIVLILFFNLLNWIDFSFFCAYSYMQFLINVSWSKLLFHSCWSILCKGNKIFWGLLLLNSCIKV